MAVVELDEVQSQLKAMLQDALRLEFQLQLKNISEIMEARKQGDLEAIGSLLQKEVQEHASSFKQPEPEKRKSGTQSSKRPPANANSANAICEALQEEASASEQCEQPRHSLVSLASQISPEEQNELAQLQRQRTELKSDNAAEALPGVVQPGEGLRSVVPGSGTPQVVEEEETHRSSQKTEMSMAAEASDAAERRRRFRGRYLQSQEFIRRGVVQNRHFDMFMTATIVLNAILMGVQSNWMIMNIGKDLPVVFEIFEIIFALVFLAELLLRLIVFRIVFFTGPDWKWNMFDGLIVGLQLFEMIAASAKVPSADFGFLKMLRILRLLRLLRLVRLLRFISELRAMVTSIVSSLKSLMWTLVLLLLLMYVLGVGIVQLIADAGQENADLMTEAPDLYAYYPDLTTTMISLFQAMTSGVDWNDLMKPLVLKVSPFIAPLFVLYIAFVTLAMMNVVTGIFVETALASSRHDRDKEVEAQVRVLFDQTDTDCSGSIGWDEFLQHLEDPDMAKHFSGLGIELSEARGLFMLLDSDGSETLDCNEFIDGCLHLRGQARAIDLAALSHSYKRSFEWQRRRLTYLADAMDYLVRRMNCMPKINEADVDGTLVADMTEFGQKRSNTKVVDDDLAPGIFVSWNEIRNAGIGREINLI